MELLSSLLLLLSVALPHIEGVHECCPGENILSLITKSCSTKDSIALQCNGTRFPLVNERKLEEFNFLLSDDGTLINKNTHTEVRYCQSYPHNDTANQSSHIYIVCVENNNEESFDDNKIKVGAILGYISVAFIILTIIIYAMVPNLLDLQGICMLHALIGLAAGYTFLGVIQLSTFLDETSCNLLAFLTYFCFLYLFFWLNTLSFHIWRTTVKPAFLTWEIKWTIVYHVFAIGATFVFLLFLLLAHYSTSEMWDDIRPGIGIYSCWFQSTRETMIFFYGPITVLLFLNIVFYLWTIIVLWREVENNQNKILKYRLKLCVRLFIIMGITWTFEILTAVFKDPQMSFFGKIMFFLLDLFNILQGLLIFLVLVVFRKRVRRALASKNLCNIQFPNSWKYLEDEEMESIEQRTNGTVAEYRGNEVEIKR